MNSGARSWGGWGGGLEGGDRIMVQNVHPAEVPCFSSFSTLDALLVEGLTLLSWHSLIFSQGGKEKLRGDEKFNKFQR